jgi:F-type H+-transporting ATPase subunit b
MRCIRPPAECECMAMNVLLLMAEVQSSESPERIATTFGVDWPHLLAQIISFCIVCFVLYRFAYKPILTMLEVRRQQIADGIANAEKIKAELAQTESQRREVMMQAKADSTRFIEEARAAAARLQAEESQKAIAAAEQIMAKAREAAAVDQARMLADLRQEVGRLVVQTTAIVVGKVLTPEDQVRLAEEAARQLAHSGNGKATRE